VILCNAQRGAGNFTEVVRSMLRNIGTQNDSKTTYTSDNYFFHVAVDNGLIFLCTTESDDGKKPAYAFLTEIQRDFANGNLQSRAHFATEGELNGEFSGTMQQLMEQYSRRGNDNMAMLQSQVDEVRGVMTQNIEKVLQRGENLEDLMDKTTDLEIHSMAFKKTARQVHRKMWWKNTKMMCILGIVVVTVIAIIILIILFSTGILPPDNGGNKPAATTTVAPPK